MTDSRPAISRLRWYQFRLRTLMVVVLLVAVACSWFTVKRQRARRQARQVQAIRVETDLGLVWYDYEVDADGRRLSAPKAPAPAWLVNLLGIDFFADVVSVTVIGGGSDCTKHLESLTELRTLELFNTRVTDAGLERLGGLTGLERLQLSIAEVTDAGLEHLKGFANLRELDLSGAQVTDAGLEHLQGLTNLVQLDLHGTQVTEQGVKRLRQALPKCDVYY
jgi:hypothetical protein